MRRGSCSHNGAGRCRARTVESLEPRRLMAAGALDPTFGGDGIAAVDVLGSDRGDDVVVQPDGKVVVAGSADVYETFPGPFTGDFAVARFTAAGEPDATFGQGGAVRTDFGKQERGAAVLLQPDGRIVVGGSTGSGSVFDFALARYLPDGALDPSFGAGGRVVTNFGADAATRTDDRIRALALQPDGKIVAVGRGAPDFAPSLGVARYNADGSLDATFGTGGRVSMQVIGGATDGWDVALRGDGRIIITTTAASGGPLGGAPILAFVRLLPDGTPDGSFGFRGARLDDVGLIAPTGLELAPDGSMYVAGMYSADTGTETRAYKFLTDGTQVLNYGTGGHVTVATGGFVGYPAGTVLQPNGNLVVATTTDGPTFAGSGSWTVASILPGGAFDNTFGTGGRTRVEPGVPNLAILGDVALAPDGKVVLGGTAAFADGGNNLTAARLTGVPAPARVEQVVVWGSRWGRRFFDALADAGLGVGGFAAGTTGAAAAAPEGTWSNVDRVSVRFAADAPVTAGDLTLRGTRLGLYTPSDFSYDATARTATWSLDRSVVAERLRIDLSSRAAAGGYRADVVVLGGDVDRNAIVTMADLFDLRSRLAGPAVVAGGVGYDVFHDVDGSGRIDAADLASARRLWPSRLSTTGVAVVAAAARTAASRRGLLDEVLAPMAGALQT